MVIENPAVGLGFSFVPKESIPAWPGLADCGQRFVAAEQVRFPNLRSSEEGFYQGLPPPEEGRRAEWIEAAYLCLTAARRRVA